MKKILVWLLVTIFTLSVVFLGTACKEETTETKEVTPAEETTETGEATEEVAKEPITISFAAFSLAEEAFREPFNRIIDNYEKQNPNITIEAIPIPYGEIQQQVVTMAAGGNPVDIAQLTAQMPFELAGMNELEDMSNLVPESYLNDIWPSALDSCYYEGSLISLPWVMCPLALWYNKELMADAGILTPPEDWDELLNDLDIIKAAYEGQGIDTLSLFTAPPIYSISHGIAWFWAYGSTPFAGKGNIDTPEFKETLAWYRKMVNEGYTTGGWKLREFRETFANNKLVFIFDSQPAAGIFMNLNPDITKENINDIYGVAKFPFGKIKNTQIDSWQLVVSNKCENKEAAWDFIEFLSTSSIAMEEFILPSMGLPALQSLAEEEYASEFSDPISRAFVEDVMPYLKAMPYSPLFSQAAGAVSDQGIQKACFTDEPIDKIAEELQAVVNDIYGW